MACSHWSSPLKFYSLGGRHVPQRSHYGFQTSGDLAVGSLKAPRPHTLGIELRGEPISLVGQSAKLLLEPRRCIALFEKLTQEAFESIDRCPEPRQCLLQSVSLGHGDFLPLTAPASPRSNSLATLRPSTRRQYDSVVTAMPVFKKEGAKDCFLILLAAPANIDSTAPKIDSAAASVI
jgi:hypothetical protein